LLSCPKISKPPHHKLLKIPIKALESNNNCNLSQRFKSQPQKYYSITERKYDEDKPLATGSSPRKSNLHRPIHTYYIREGTENHHRYQKSGSFQMMVSPIVYPLLIETRKKKLFRKMDKFQNFVFVSFRK
jgi:hypothetical protein